MTLDFPWRVLLARRTEATGDGERALELRWATVPLALVVEPAKSQS